MGKNANFVSHKKSKQKNQDGTPQLPLASALVEGEIAINFAENVETLSIKNESGDVVTFSSDNYYSEKKLGSAFTGANSAVTVTDVIEENEEIIAAALTDLDERKLDASAYTPSVELWESGTGLNSVVLKGSSGTASGDYSVAEGNSTSAMSPYSHTEGYKTFVNGPGSEHAEGYYTNAINHSHAEGDYTSATTYSHTEGYGTFAFNYSHAEGYFTKAINYYSHAEGQGTSATSQASHAEGAGTLVSGDFSHAEGQGTEASGHRSHAEGLETVARGNSSHAEGQSTSATSDASHSEGYETLASGYYSHAEGDSTSATSYVAHAEGNHSLASGDESHAEGRATKAAGEGSHAEGDNTEANGDASHAEGYISKANGDDSHAEGYNTIANGDESHTEGVETIANNDSEHASGQYNISHSATTEFGDSGNTLFSVGNGYYDGDAHTVVRHNAFEIRQNGDIYITSGSSDIKLQDYIGGGGGSITVDQVLDDTTSASTNPVSSKAVYDAVTDNELVWTNAYVALSGTVSAHTANTEIHVTAADKARWNSSSDSLWESGTGLNSVVLKNSSGTASGDYSVAEGYQTSATSYQSHAEGRGTVAAESQTHAEGYETQALGWASHTEGMMTVATNNFAHAEGGYTRASGTSSHAEGSSTSATSDSSHAEGAYTIASGGYSHAEGQSTSATSYASHTEGYSTKASGDFSHAEGQYTIANNDSEHASGQYNVSNSATTTFGNSGNTLFSVGNGISTNARHNAFEIRQNGDIYVNDGTNDVKLQDTIINTAANTTALGGFNLVQITQSDYDSLQTKDPHTLYIIIN